MIKLRVRGEEVRRFILDHIKKHPTDIAKVTADHFAITRQAVHKHLTNLVNEGTLIQDGKTRAKSYKLRPLTEWSHEYELVPSLAEDIIWTTDIAQKLGHLPENVLQLWHHGFTEMFNNAIDHSEGTTIYVHLTQNATESRMAIVDNGVGIFNKIKNTLGLIDERHAIFELAKGKLTTAPQAHSGEGIFFTSRMFDEFNILSGGVVFSHTFGDQEDWLSERDHFKTGTTVFLQLSNHTARTQKGIYEQFSSDGNYGFNKTVVPVRLAKVGNDQLISRSQAKRLLARIDRFQVVMFDFQDVDFIGQAFADEVFRVFANAHAEIKLLEMNTNDIVQGMIDRARAANQ